MMSSAEAQNKTSLKLAPSKFAKLQHARESDSFFELLKRETFALRF